MFGLVVHIDVTYQIRPRRNGHISADCDKPAGNKCCYNCGGEGHIARDCEEPAAE